MQYMQDNIHEIDIFDHAVAKMIYFSGSET